jgi:hypothetical protein
LIRIKADSHQLVSNFIESHQTKRAVPRFDAPGSRRQVGPNKPGIPAKIFAMAITTGSLFLASGNGLFPDNVLAQRPQCPPHSHWDGSQCKCDAGYGSADGKSCRPMAELAQCPPHSHWDGKQCKCDAGYGVFPGDNRCTSYSSICRRFDSHARYNSAINDCECGPGYVENDAANRCDPVGAAKARSAAPAPDKKATTASRPYSHQLPEGNSGGDLHVRIHRGWGSSNKSEGSIKETIDANSKPTGNMRTPVKVDGKTVYMTESGAEAYHRTADDATASTSVKPDADTKGDFWGGAKSSNKK